MGKIALFALVIVLAALGAGIVYALTAEIPPPTGKIEEVLPNDRFPR